MASWKFCNCCGVDNECLIHSTITAKGKAWPALVLETGTAPTESDNLLEFTAVGKVRFDHDDIKYWDGSAFVDETTPGYNNGNKRVRLIVTLLDDDSCLEMTVMDDGAGHYKKVRFVADTPAIAKYPIVYVVWYVNIDDGTGTYDFTYEDITDRWLENYRVSYKHAEVSGASGTTVSSYTLPDANYVGSSSYEYGVQLDETIGDIDDNPSIWLECVSGRVNVSHFELYHKSYGEAVTEPDTRDGPTCGAEVTLETPTLCNGYVGDGGGPTALLSALNQPRMANTLPDVVELILPTGFVNPDAGGSAIACADCTVGAGESLLLWLSTDDYLADEAFCEYQSTEFAPIACNEGQIDAGSEVWKSTFYPWFDDADNPGVTVAYYDGTFGTFWSTEIEPLAGTGHPFLASLAYTDYDNVRNWNAAVAIDHVGLSGTLLYEFYTTGQTEYFACSIVGEVAFIQLPDVASWGFA